MATIGLEEPLRTSGPTGLEERLDALLAQLRTEEKVALLSGSTFFKSGGVPRLGLPEFSYTDGPHGARGDPSHDGAVLMPCEQALASSFDEELLQEVGCMLGCEAARRGAHILLAPTINLNRLPNSGRHFECFSEDPHLTARLGVAYIRGVQRYVGACAKHIVANEAENHRRSSNSVIGERVLREVYLLPFEAAVKEGKVASIMNAYNRCNGIYCSEHRWIMQQVCRQEWQFEGFFLSDWGANRSTVDAISAGLNVEMPRVPPYYYGGFLLDAVKEGHVSEDLLNERCRPVLRVLLLHGDMPDPPRLDDSHRRDLTRRAAAESLVLLKNEGDALPLKTSGMRKIALIGPNAADLCISGGGSSRVHPRQCLSFLEAFRVKLAPSVEVVCEPGTVRSEAMFVHIGGQYIGHVGGCSASGQPESSYVYHLIEAIIQPMLFRMLGSEFYRRWLLKPVAQYTGLGGPQMYEDMEKLPESAQGSQAGMSRNATFLRCCVLFSVLLVIYKLAGLGASTVALIAGIIVTGVKSHRQAQTADVQQMELAEQAARAADACVLVLGTDGRWESESFDQPHMRLPGHQNELAVRVFAAARGPVITVLNVGSPKEIPWINQASAVLVAYFGGEEMAPALVDCLLGDSVPAGRLPTTWPQRLEHAPAVAASHPAPPWTEYIYSEELRLGYRAYSAGGPELPAPLFAFGHGLSYTQFVYEDFEVKVVGSCSDGGVGASVQVRVCNNGVRSGCEVVQLYVATAVTPRALRSFRRTKELSAGHAELLSFELDARALSGWYDVALGAWQTLGPGAEIKIDVGGSSVDVRASARVVLE